MFTVRAYNRDTGELEKPRLFADEVTEDTRRSLSDLYNYTCLGCRTAHYHWRKETRRHGNQETLRQTFVRNRGTGHELGCRYDYSGLARDNKHNVYIKNDELHIRVNFPLGSANHDLHPPRGDAAHPPRSEEAVIKKEPIDSVRKLVDLIEKKFDGLEDEALGDVKLDYQGQVYRWDDLFVPSDNYKRLYQNENKYVLVAVKPSHEIHGNDKGKRKFVCEAQYAKPGYKELSIKPVLVVEDEDTASYVRQMIDRVKRNWNKDPEDAKKNMLLVAADPFIPDPKGFRHVNIYLNVTRRSQIARIEGDKYWRLISGKRHQLSMIDQLTPQT